MNSTLHQDANQIITESLQAVLPDAAVNRALDAWGFTDQHAECRNSSSSAPSFETSSRRTILVATGKAAWQMAKAATEKIGDQIDDGIVITKYSHVQGELPGLTCVEAGHPVPDENSFRGTQMAIDLVSDLTADDKVLFLLSGGGSALFELPLIEGSELQSITNALLASGADIVEMNTIRKRLSAVKGGRFANLCAPAQVYTIVLSDILGDPLDMIASGPACADSTTCDEAKTILQKYNITLSEKAAACIEAETPKVLNNVTTQITGSVRELCSSAAASCEKLGYKTIVLTDMLNCEAREAGRFMAAVLKTYMNQNENLAIIAGGETVVHLRGNGKGGRNQELALAAATEIIDLEGVALFSIGSDGTDGPTDAAGALVDGHTAAKISAKGIQIFDALKNNDAYNALNAADALIITGPTGTNVNDVAVGLIRAVNSPI